MSPSDATNRATRREWQELGFFYETEEPARRWRLIGSKSGLRRFPELLRKYCADPRNSTKSEHEHYGPYMYLKVMTWPDFEIDGQSIRGPLPKLARLADLVGERLADAEPDEVIYIGREFAPDVEYDLVLEVKSEGFDPAEADPCLR